MTKWIYGVDDIYFVESGDATFCRSNGEVKQRFSTRTKEWETTLEFYPMDIYRILEIFKRQEINYPITIAEVKKEIKNSFYSEVLG
jgi:hypothetical protein